VLSAHRHTDDEITHHVHHRVVAEVALRAEEARAPPEVHLAADDAAAHPPGADAERGLTVLDVAAEGRPDPGRDEPVRARLHRRENDRGGRRKNE